ncbi:MAG: cysteine desulfurase family protein [Erysipelotrichaceae bacterium]|nr:cysteine desulfurase family protein [Erysipelotrichaceae bacterium]
MANINYYFDSVSTTKPYPEVLELYNKLSNKYYANSDALYQIGVEAYKLLEQARKRICDICGYRDNELIFTSGASEANNFVFKGVVLANLKKKIHIITSAYEHSSIINNCKQLERLFDNVEITYLKPDDRGKITVELLLEALRDNTVLVSIMTVNNEVGAINDIDELAAVVKKRSKAYFHSDITQALGKLKLDLSNVDLASFSAHKFHGLKGCGGLFKKQHIHLETLITAGQQEFGMRGGTSDYLSIMTMAKALIISNDQMVENNHKLDLLMKELEGSLSDIEGIKIVLPKYHINNLLLITTPLTSEVMLNALNKKNIFVSSKSTCGTRSDEESVTAKALAYDGNRAIRISLLPEMEVDDIKYLVENIKEAIEFYGKIKL